MAEITAQLVNELRKRTGLGLMECKSLLKKSEGDLKAAETLAKELNLVKAQGRAGRASTAGRIEVLLAPDGKAGAIVELGCETDFVARNDDFRQATRDLAEHILEGGPGADSPESKFKKDPSKTLSEVLVDLGVRTGENVSLVRSARFTVEGPGRVDAYVHHDAKSGALVEVRGEAEPALVKDLALQVVAAKPLCVRREEMPAEEVAEQKRIFMTQAADKPENVREKIATGKLDSWFAENALLDQVYVKDSGKKVRDVVAAAGAGIDVSRFARFVVGEAAETAAAQAS